MATGPTGPTGTTCPQCLKPASTTYDAFPLFARGQECCANCSRVVQNIRRALERDGIEWRNWTLPVKQGPTGCRVAPKTPKTPTGPTGPLVPFSGGNAALIAAMMFQTGFDCGDVD